MLESVCGICILPVEARLLDVFNGFTSMIRDTDYTAELFELSCQDFLIDQIVFYNQHFQAFCVHARAIQ